MQTQTTNTKCRIDCAKYKVKWNIEFWRKWNAISSERRTIHALNEQFDPTELRRARASSEAIDLRTLEFGPD